MGRVAPILLPEGGGEEEREEERERGRGGWKEEGEGRGEGKKLCYWTSPHTFFSIEALLCGVGSPYTGQRTPLFLVNSLWKYQKQLEMYFTSLRVSAFGQVANQSELYGGNKKSPVAKASVRLSLTLV